MEQEHKEIPKKKWFGRGIYGSKDIPIRILDGLIAVLILLTISLTVIFAIHGGYVVSFDTDGGETIEPQKLRHGSLAEDPGIPVKAGYEFEGWFYGPDLENPWYFSINKVSEDVILVARWVPANVTVKFDLNGGVWSNRAGEPSMEVTFGESYGELPIPEKSGAVFDGWVYSGQKITEDTKVTVNGEHVLTAQWK